VDKSIDRKKRIAALKERGFSVFPALKLEEARSRCRPGVYDLIIVNAQDEPELAAAFCDELRSRTPTQAVLLAVSNGAGKTGQDYLVQDDPDALAQRASSLLGPQHADEESDQKNRQTSQSRLSA
jgi:DNA-binding response OmpR family regulator